MVNLNSKSTGVTWWSTLIFIGFTNFYLLLKIVFFSKRYKSNLFMSILCTNFFFACFFCSIFICDTHGRICFFDTILCSPIVNRTVAAYGEISFGIIGVLLIKELLNKFNKRYIVTRCFNGLWFILVLITVVANISSHMGAITHISTFLVFEEQLWLVYSSSISIIVLLSVVEGFLRGQQKVLVKMIKTRMRLFIMFFILFSFCTLWAIYLYYIDIPMYKKQIDYEIMNKIEPLTISEGFYHSLKCDKVTKDISDFVDIRIWQSLYFIFGPFSTIIMVYIGDFRISKIKNK